MGTQTFTHFVTRSLTGLHADTCGKTIVSVLITECFHVYNRIFAPNALQSNNILPYSCRNAALDAFMTFVNSLLLHLLAHYKRSWYSATGFYVVPNWMFTKPNIGRYKLCTTNAAAICCGKL